jgi:hypothetical protein
MRQELESLRNEVTTLQGVMRLTAADAEKARSETMQAREDARKESTRLAVGLDKMQQRVAELEEGMGRMGAVHRSKQKRGSKKQTRKAARREKKNKPTEGKHSNCHTLTHQAV